MLFFSCNLLRRGVCSNQEKFKNMKGFKLGIVLAIAGIFFVPKMFAQLGRHTCDTMDLVFIGDFSKSYRQTAWQAVTGFEKYTRTLNIDSNTIKIGFNWFDAGDHPRGISGNRNDIKEELQYVKTIQPNYGTRLTQALKRLWMMFYNSSTAREKCCNQTGVQRCVILMTDGGMVDYESALEEANALKASGVLICVITIGKVGKKATERLQSIATDPLYFIKTDFKHLEQHLLELELCL